MDRAEAVSEMNKGLEALEGGRTLDAVRHLKEASTIDPEFAEPPYYLGQIYHRKLSEPDSAEQNYREAMSRDETNPQFAYQLGTILQEQNKHSDAIAYLKKATEAKPDFAKAWFRLGLSFDFEKDYSSAIDAYSKSIHANARMRMDKEDKGGAAYHALGDLYNRFGFYDHALKVYSNALENNPDVPRLLSGEGVAQLKLKRFPKLKPVSRRLSKSTPVKPPRFLIVAWRTWLRAQPTRPFRDLKSSCLAQTASVMKLELLPLKASFSRFVRKRKKTRLRLMERSNREHCRFFGACVRSSEASRNEL